MGRHMPANRTSETLNQRNANFDNRLRPGQFTEFIGQQKIRDRLELAVKAAKDRHETLDHVLVSGPPASARPPFPTSSATRWAST